jgi:hypothetical protein
MALNEKIYITFLKKEEIIDKNIVIGFDDENRRTLLIKNSVPSGENPIFKTDYFRLKTNVSILIENEEIGSYHILTCVMKDIVIVDSFDRVCNYLFIKNNKALSIEEMLKLFNSIELIFKSTQEKDLRNTQIGAFGELFTLKYLFSNGYGKIARNWHTDIFLKHDIEINKKNRIEIKTTTTEKRIHRFRHDQIFREDINVYVISVMLEESEIGYSLYDLFIDVIGQFSDMEKIFSLEVLMKKCGISKSTPGIVCNDSKILENLKIFDAKFLPKFNIPEPEGVSGTSYDVDFANVKDLDLSELERFK